MARGESTAPDTDAWLQQVAASYATYTPPPEAVGMTTRYELCFVESYARDRFTGQGAIVDLGCWYGATTAALARGLAANTVASGNRRIEAFDLFRWEPWMSRHMHRLKHLDRSYEVHDSFLDDVRELLAPYADLVELEARDLSRVERFGKPIEFLFIDAQKSWSLGRAIASSHFPDLIPGTSYVVQQDFVWYHPTILSVHLLMWHMREHFEFVHDVPGSCSTVFRCTSAIDLTQPPPPPTYFDVAMIEEAYAWCLGWVEDPRRLPYLQAAKLFSLLERDFLEEALEHAEHFLDHDGDLPRDLAAGMRDLLPVYERRAAERADLVRAIQEKVVSG